MAAFVGGLKDRTKCAILQVFSGGRGRGPYRDDDGPGPSLCGDPGGGPYKIPTDGGCASGYATQLSSGRRLPPHVLLLQSPEAMASPVRPICRTGHQALWQLSVSSFS
jgi:hypothetical protein